MNKYTLTLLVTLSMAMSLAARQLTPQQALEELRRQQSACKQHTESPLQTMDQTDGGSDPVVVKTISDASGKATLYVFQRPQGGYMIVSANDAAEHMLWGYTESGSFQAQTVQSGLQDMLQIYSNAVSLAASGEAENAVMASRDNDTKPDIAPLLKSAWSQVAPFNEMCPNIGTTTPPTGCVATSMAQVMHVHHWPEKGSGSNTYTPYAVGHSVTVDFSATTYDWDNMIYYYTQNPTQTQIDAVATLMLSCGVAVDMNYGVNASGASFGDIGPAMLKYFNYDKGIYTLSRDYIGIAEWEQLVYDELAAGRPVIYSGRSDDAAHAFVVDGYQNGGYFHIDWGLYPWEMPGYFLLTQLNPDVQDVAGATGGFNVGQAAVFGIQPPVEGSIVRPVIQFNSSIETAVSHYSRNSGTVKILDTRGIFCHTVEASTATMGLKLVNQATGQESYVSSTTRTYSPGQGFTNYTIPVSEFPGEGEYIATPVVSDSVGTWYAANVKLSCVGELQLTVTADSLIFTSEPQSKVVATDLRALTRIYAGQPCNIAATLTNPTDDEFYEKVTPVLEQDNVEKATQEVAAVEVEAGDSESMEWVGSFPASTAAGTYKLFLVDTNGNKLNSEGVDVEVLPALTEATAYKVAVEFPGSTGGSGESEDDPALVDLKNFHARVNINCTTGYYNGFQHATFFAIPRSGITTFGDDSFVGLGKGESSSIDYQGDASAHLSPGTTYMFIPYNDKYGYASPAYFQGVDATAAIDGINSDDIRLNVWPNPATDILTVGSEVGLGRIDLYNLSGAHTVGADGYGHNQVQLSVSQLPAGLYLMRVVVGTGQVRVVKVVKR